MLQLCEFSDQPPSRSAAWRVDQEGIMHYSGRAQFLTTSKDRGSHENIAFATSREIQLEGRRRQRLRSAVKSARAEGCSFRWQIDEKAKAATRSRSQLSGGASAPDDSTGAGICGFENRTEVR